MADMKLERKGTLPRQQAAQQLSALAPALAEGSHVEMVLEVVSQRCGKLSVADQRAGQLQQARVDVRAVLVAGA